MNLCPPRRLPSCDLPGGRCQTWHHQADAHRWVAQIRPGKALLVRPWGWLPDDNGPCRSVATSCPDTVQADLAVGGARIDAADWLIGPED